MGEGWHDARGVHVMITGNDGVAFGSTSTWMDRYEETSTMATGANAGGSSQPAHLGIPTPAPNAASFGGAAGTASKATHSCDPDSEEEI